MDTITWEDFQKIDLRVGTIIKAEPFPEAKRPAYKLWIDLGVLGIKKSSAQITGIYELNALVGKQVLCVCNFLPKQIGPLKSEVLVTGFTDSDNKVVLATTDHPVPNGTKLA